MNIDRSIAHEYSHVIRYQALKTQKSNLAEDIASEGIAQCFSESVTGEREPWSKAIPSKRAVEQWGKIKKQLDSRSRDFHDRLFLGKEIKNSRTGLDMRLATLL